MNLPKAIELNKESEKSLRDGKFHDHADAIKISNEAIARLQVMRSYNIEQAVMPLPTEKKG